MCNFWAGLNKMKFVDFDMAAFPKVRVTFNRAPESLEEMTDYLAEFEALLNAALSMAQQVRFIFVIADLPMASALQYIEPQVEFVRRIAVEGSADLPEQPKARLVDAVRGTSIVITNYVVRKLVETVLKVVTLQKPYHAAKSVEDAEAWLDALDGDGLVA